MEGNLRKVSKAVAAIADESELDRCLLERYDEQLNVFKVELYGISRNILSMEGDVSELSDHEDRGSKAIFDVNLKINVHQLIIGRVLSSPRSTYRLSMGTL